MSGSAPSHLVVRANGQVSCPRRGEVPLAVCLACPALHGTLDEADTVVLCGGLQPRPAFRRRIPAGSGRG